MALGPHVIEIKGLLLPWTTGCEQYCCCVLRLAAGWGLHARRARVEGELRSRSTYCAEGRRSGELSHGGEEELGLGAVGREEQGASTCCLVARRRELGWSLREAAMEERRCHGWLHRWGRKKAD
jgi:hypothetical protein